MNDASSAELPIKQAATVIVLRDTPSGPEVLLMLRASELVFHGGAWVFPGGRVDPEDEVPGDELATARNTAVREAFEEAGLTLEPSALRTVSHWTTPPARPRRFATWFFATELATPVDIVVDGSEISTHCWLRPDDALAARARGELELPPPTFVTLWMLREFASVAAYFAHLELLEPPIYVPHPRAVEGGLLSLYHGDVAYEGGAPEQSGPRHRLHMLKQGWRYERDAG